MRFPHFVLVVLAGLSPWILQVQGAAPQDVSSDIAKADSLYYQGQYTEALALLSQLDVKLAAGNSSLDDRAKVKMLFGLTELSLDDNTAAHLRFVEFCTLNPGYVMDELRYPRRVVSAFQDAQKDCAKCVQICARSESLVAAGNVAGIQQIKADTESCGCAARNLARDDEALRHGRELLAQEKYPEALREFQTVLAAVPDSAARREAIVTAQAKINLTLEAAVADWRKQFQARDFAAAAATYDRIRSLGELATGTVRDSIAQVAARYQSTFQDLTKSWTAACSKNDRVALDAIREWSKSLDPNRTIQPNALNQMKECTNPPAANGTAGK